MANDEIHLVSIYGSARSVAGMRTPDHMLTKVESNRIVATDCSSGPVLVVDDDPAVRHLISDYFGQHGITTVSATGRSAVARELAGGDTSAIILDLHLGQDDGFDLLREIRSSSDVPVIILTGRARDEVDCVVGLELGADDYLTKPFGIRELYARYRAVLRRRENGRSVRTHDVAQGEYRFDGWRLDRRSRRLTDPQERPVALSKSEYALLLAFLDAPERVLSREYLLQATRLHEDISDRSIDVQVLRLRRKLEADPKQPRVIKTERGVGYAFAIPVEQMSTSIADRALTSTLDRSLCGPLTQKSNQGQPFHLKGAQMTPSISNSAFRTLSDLPSPAIWVHNSSKADILRPAQPRSAESAR